MLAKDIDKEFHYSIVKHKDEKLSGITFDESVKNVTVTVKKENSKLVTDVYYYEEYDRTFKNKYEAAGTVQFKGTKKLTGKKLKDKQFSFAIMEGDRVVQVVKNDKNGNIEFQPIHFTADDIGEHVYKIGENSSSAAFVTIDKTVYTVKVTVSDNGDGTLKIETSGDNCQALNFTNAFSNTPGDKGHSPNTSTSFRLWIWPALMLITAIAVFALRFKRNLHQ